MKKIVTLLIVISVVMACGTSKTVRESKRVIKGEWTLSSVTYNQAGTYAVTLLNDATKECFEGSYWRFIPNNNSGYIQFQKQDVQKAIVILFLPLMRLMLSQGTMISS